MPIQPYRPDWPLYALIAALAMAMVYVVVGEAGAHQAPTGWVYPIACCSNQDCREVGDAHVVESVDGYHVPSGEVVAYRDRRVRNSPDGRYHWCTSAGSDDGRTICLFVPARSF